MPKALDIACPKCGRAIPAADVNIDTAIGRCLQCDAVFSFADDLPKPERGEGGILPQAVADVPMPDRIRVEDDALTGGFRIVRRWFTPAVLFMILFCVVWDGFLAFWYSMAFKSGAPLIMKIFPIVHLAAGVVLTWYTIATLFNRTTILVTYEAVSVRHRPIPWLGNRRIPAEQIEQLYCEESGSTRSNNRTTVQYAVNIRTADGRKVKLVSGVERDQALFIEQRIERFLDIKPQRVPGDAGAV